MRGGAGVKAKHHIQIAESQVSNGRVQPPSVNVMYVGGWMATRVLSRKMRFFERQVLEIPKNCNEIRPVRRPSSRTKWSSRKRLEYKKPSSKTKKFLEKFLPHYFLE